MPKMRTQKMHNFDLMKFPPLCLYCIGMQTGGWKFSVETIVGYS